MAKKKVLIVGPLSSGHIQNWIMPFLDEYQFIFFTLHNTELSAEFSDCKTINFPRVTGTRLDFLFAIPFLQYCVNKYRPDLIHGHFLSSYGLMLAPIYAKCKKVLSIWGTDINGKVSTNSTLKFLAKGAIQRYAKINAPANHMADKLLDLGAKKEQIDVFQYGIKLESYPTKEVNRKNDVRFLSIRNWDELYNIENVIKAYHEFGRQFQGKSELIIVGRSTPERSAGIQHLADKCSTEHAKVTIAGFLNKEQLLALIANSDVVVSVPTMDGLPLSVLEAMYVGLYPLVSDIDANRELFDDAQATFVNASEIEQIVNGYHKSTQLVTSSQLAQVLERNRQYVIEHASYDKNTKKLKAIYDSLSL